MKKLFYPLAALILIAASAFTFFKGQDWTIGSNYSIKFSSSDPSGVFTGLKGAVSFDEKNLGGSKFDVTVDVASINTGNGMQNTHAKSAQWFDAEKYPVIKFTSSQISKSSEGYEAKGTLDLHGVQKEITIPFTFKDNTFSGSFQVNRNDFNLNPDNKKAGSDIKVEVSVPVTKS